jgi:hypothetical protein
MDESARGHAHHSRGEARKKDPLCQVRKAQQGKREKEAMKKPNVWKGQWSMRKPPTPFREVKP